MIFLKTPLQLTCMSEACQALRYMIVNLLFITCKQLIPSSFENLSPLKKKHFPYKFNHKTPIRPLARGFSNISLS